jgi:hypothetical protein
MSKEGGRKGKRKERGRRDKEGRSVERGRKE